MPELPEVTTTVRGLNEVLPKLVIKDVWSDYFLRTKNKRTDTIKNKKYFEHFKKEVIGERFLNAERRGKNILIHLSSSRTILIHMKMTGHLLYGTYKRISKSQFPMSKRKLETWLPAEKGLLQDSFNKFIHLIFTLSNGKHLAFSDMRKFAKVILFETHKRDALIDLAGLGPEPLDNLSLQTLKRQLLSKPNGKIKTVLMDQSVLAGIGNIYSDEILWRSDLHPERTAVSLSEKELRDMWKAIKVILLASIKMGGDSMSDYRNIYGQKGGFQNTHKVYRRTKEKCLKKGCGGRIQRKIIGGRSSHFCNKHQI
ncbi:MAG TPA: bifunctional DNA-formamidopyrimidine glycosylase/DNA-(apurinic or apyrimidinic site) lyase [Candidatus Paceibacterota bacterium]